PPRPSSDPGRAPRPSLPRRTTTVRLRHCRAAPRLPWKSRSTGPTRPQHCARTTATESLSERAQARGSLPSPGRVPQSSERAQISGPGTAERARVRPCTRGFALARAALSTRVVGQTHARSVAVRLPRGGQAATWWIAPLAGGDATMTTPPPLEVFDLFAVPGPGVPLAGGQGHSVCAGDLVLSPGRDERVAAVLNPVLAPFAAQLDSERPRTLRLAMPIPTRDLRWVVDGWGATRFEPGASPCHDLDVLTATSRLFHARLAAAVPIRPDGL